MSVGRAPQRVSGFLSGDKLLHFVEFERVVRDADDGAEEMAEWAGLRQVRAWLDVRVQGRMGCGHRCTSRPSLALQSNAITTKSPDRCKWKSG